MKSKLNVFRSMAAVVILSVLLAACGSPAPTATQAPATEAPAATQAPATEAPAATEAPLPRKRPQQRMRAKSILWIGLAILNGAQMTPIMTGLQVSKKRQVVKSM